MKRMLALLIVLLLTLSACGKTPAPETTAATQATTGYQVVAPLAAAVSDATTAVSFTPEDITTDEAGNVTLTLTLYDYEHFSAMEIEALSQGDRLILEGETLTVETLEWTDGVVTINGAPEDGGVTLMADAFGQYFQLLDPYAESYPRYYAIGTRTGTLAEDFTFTDSSDLEQGEQTCTAAEFVTLAPTGDPLSTTAIFAGDTIAAISRRYIP